AAADENLIHAGGNLAHGVVNGLHGGAAQAVDRVAGDVVRQSGQQRGVAADVHALFLGLLHAAPDDVLDGLGLDRRVALKQRADQRGRQILGAGVAKHAALGAAHGGAYRVDYDN